MVKANEQDIKAIADELFQKADDYKANLTKLTNLVEEITNGDIQGDLATDLLNKFQAKEETFKKLESELIKAEDAMKAKNEELRRVVEDTTSRMS